MFKIGQKVVCKNDKNLLPNSSVKSGKIYTVLGTDYDCSNLPVIFFEETENGTKYGYPYFYGYNPNRFEPLKYEIISNKEIIKEVITEKSDLPIKEPVKFKNYVII